MNDLDLFYQYLKGRYHDNQIHFRRFGIQKRNWISLLNVCINSANDAYISCENFVKFGPEFTELICERQVRHGQKMAYLVEYLRFSQSFHYMKALYVQMMDLYLIFQFVKGRCHGNQIMLP